MIEIIKWVLGLSGTLAFFYLLAWIAGKGED